MKFSDLTSEFSRHAPSPEAPSQSRDPVARDVNSTGIRLRVLMVARLFRLPYRVLRCIHAAGAQVYVLGGEQARPLATSRFCEEFLAVKRIVSGIYDADFAEEINAHAARLGIDMVLAGDAPSTRALIAIRRLINAPCFPMPELPAFDLLNDKWRFGALCRSLAIDTPDSTLFSGAGDLARAIDANPIRFPKIAKPLSMDGGEGVIKLEPMTARTQVSSIGYSPILVQEFIDGEDICASAYCENGEIAGFACHRFDGVEFATFQDASIQDHVRKIARRMSVDGVLNFDLVRAKDGRVFFLECNPRFFFSMAMTMVAGINFVSLGLPARRSAATAAMGPARSVQFRIPNPRPLLLGFLMPWKLKLMSWDALRFWLADPLPSLRKGFSPVDERRIDLSSQSGFPPRGMGAESLLETSRRPNEI